MKASDWPYMLGTELAHFLSLSDMVVENEWVLWSYVEKWLLHDNNRHQLEHNLR